MLKVTGVLALITGITGVAQGGPAVAQALPDGTYLRIFGGATSMIDGGGETGPIGGLAFGTRISSDSAWRAEIELSRRDGSGTKGTAAMLNVLRDMGQAGPATLYAGLGIGAMKVDTGADSDTGAAAQAILGAGFEIGTATDFTLELRYVDAGDAPDGSDAAWADVTAGFVFEF